MNRAQEIDIFTRYSEASGQLKSRIEAEIIDKNMGLVTILSRKFDIPGYDREDLVSLGVTALISSMRQFDIAKGYKFSTYAGRSIFYKLWKEYRNYRLGFGIKCASDLDEDSFHAATKVTSVLGESQLRPGTLRDGEGLRSLSDGSDVDRQNDIIVKAFVRTLESDSCKVLSGLMEGSTRRSLARDMNVSLDRVEKIVDSIKTDPRVLDFISA